MGQFKIITIDIEPVRPGLDARSEQAARMGYRV
jgi:hypothetical protein